MKFNYDASLERVLKDEGGYTNDAADPGGPTNFGITIHDYRLYIDPNGSATDVKNMTLAQAKTIYESKYWGALKCDELPSGVDYAVFDYGVNSGISRSAKVLQRLIGAAADGVIGPATIAAAKAADPKKLINDMCDERMTFLKGLKTFSTFGKGWTRRVDGVRSYALSIVDQKAPPGAGAGSGTVVAAGGAGLAGWFQGHMWEILIGTAVAALVVYLMVRWYRTRIEPMVIKNVVED